MIVTSFVLIKLVDLSPGGLGISLSFLKEKSHCIFLNVRVQGEPAAPVRRAGELDLG